MCDGYPAHKRDIKAAIPIPPNPFMMIVRRAKWLLLIEIIMFHRPPQGPTHDPGKFYELAYLNSETNRRRSVSDVYIAVIGEVGSGKSTFISLCTGQDVLTGHTLAKCKYSYMKKYFNTTAGTRKDFYTPTLSITSKPCVSSDIHISLSVLVLFDKRHHQSKLLALPVVSRCLLWKYYVSFLWYWNRLSIFILRNLSWYLMIIQPPTLSASTPSTWALIGLFMGLIHPVSTIRIDQRPIFYASWLGFNTRAPNRLQEY